jgi:hypothetical protein
MIPAWGEPITDNSKFALDVPHLTRDLTSLGAHPNSALNRLVKCETSEKPHLNAISLTVCEACAGFSSQVRAQA